MTQVDVRALRAAQRFAQMDATKQSLQAAGAGGQDFGDAGPPTWNRASWDAFYVQYGRYPFSASELPPSMENCPVWAFELMGLRPTPVQVNNAV